MKVNKVSATHTAAKVVAAIKAAEDRGELILSIELSDTEFDEFLDCEPIQGTNSKWYGSNEGGYVINDIQTKNVRMPDNSMQQRPVSCYFNGVKIVRG